MFSQKLFSQRLRSLRQDKNLTIEQVGKAFNVTKQTVSRWELGERLPPLDVAAALADYFGVSLDYLIGNVDNPSRK
jgi:Predicted transcriptional regulators